MATKKSAEFRVLALPESAVTKQNDQNFGFRDSIRKLVKRDSGDDNATSPAGDGGSGVLQSANWAAQPYFQHIDPSLEYVEFTGEEVKRGASAVAGSGSGEDIVGGFTLKAHSKPINCEVVNQKGKPPKGLETLRVVKFKQLQPYKPVTSPTQRIVLDIETVKAFYNPSTSIQVVSNLPDKTVSFQSVESFEANQQFKVTFFWIGVASGQKQKAGARFAWANNLWSIVFRQDSENWVLPCLEQKINGQWRTVRKYENARFKEFHGPTTFSIRRMGGRMVVFLNTGEANYAFETLIARTSGVEGGDSELVSAKWAEGKVNVTSFGVRLRFDLELVSYNEKPEALYDERSFGDFSRRIKRSLKTPGFALDEIDGDLNDGSVSLVTGGWLPGGKDHIKRRAKLDRQGLTYTLRLLASLDGHNAPFVMNVLGRFQGNENEGDDAPLDVSAAFLNGHFESSTPDTQSRPNSLNLTFSRSILKLIAEKQGVEWRDYLRQYRLLRFETRYRLSDDSYSAWSNLGDYYIDDDDLDNPRVNSWTLSVVCRDPSMRLTAPHSTVDYRYLHDLVFLLMEKNGGSNAELFGGECVKYILGVELGSGEAARLNGNGDPLRFFRNTHYPLLSTKKGGVGYIQIGGADTGPPTFNGRILPPPRWNCSGRDWLTKISEMDFGSLFYAPLPDGDGSLYPIYASLDEWMKHVPTWMLADAVYDPGDLDFIISSMRVARKGNVNYNTAQALWNPHGVAQDKLPTQAARIAEGRVPATDPNAEEHSWRRTFVQEKVVWWAPEATEAWIQEFLGGLVGVDLQYPTVTLPRGDTRIWWGHKVKIKSHNSGENGAYSDPDMDLEGTTFRVVKVSHRFNADKHGADRFTTTLNLFPLLNGEE